MSLNAVIGKHNKDGSKMFVTPDGDESRGIWVDSDTDLRTLRFPPPVVTVRLTLAPKGVGKGIKGGFGAVKF
jgi:hypothetical protein